MLVRYDKLELVPSCAGVSLFFAQPKHVFLMSNSWIVATENLQEGATTVRKKWSKVRLYFTKPHNSARNVCKRYSQTSFYATRMPGKPPICKPMNINENCTFCNKLSFIQHIWNDQHLLSHLKCSKTLLPTWVTLSGVSLSCLCVSETQHRENKLMHHMKDMKNVQISLKKTQTVF